MNDLQHYTDACQPSQPTMIQAWLNRLIFAVSNPPSEQDTDRRSTAIVWACADLPAGVWCEETLVEAMQTFKFWPSAAEVYQLLKPHGDRMRRLHKLLQAPVPRESTVPYVLPPAPPPPPERQRTTLPLRNVVPRYLPTDQLRRTRPGTIPLSVAVAAAIRAAANEETADD